MDTRTVIPKVSTHLDIYKAKKDSIRPKVQDRYEIIGFISSGTYGRVYKAKSLDPNDTLEYAIKKFKPDKEGDASASSGISQSACREIALCRELSHENIIFLKEVMLDPWDRSISMIFEYAEHDFLQILHYHSHQERKPIPELTIKSFLWQLLNGVSYLHANWVLHRDLKPANILVTSEGVVKIGDLGLARLFQKPLQPLFNGDKVVVTIWYRAPELLLGSRHYTKAIDIWAIGCIFAELLMLRPIFKGEEAKMDNKKNIPFQRDQVQKIFEILGTPQKDRWPGLEHMPEFPKLHSFKNYPNNLRNVFQTSTPFLHSDTCYDLLKSMLEYDPSRRITANDATSHPYFMEEPQPSWNSFTGGGPKKFFDYPKRRVIPDEGVEKSFLNSSKLSRPTTSSTGSAPVHPTLNKIK